jgi:hypothetical protein
MTGAWTGADIVIGRLTGPEEGGVTMLSAASVAEPLAAPFDGAVGGGVRTAVEELLEKSPMGDTPFP